MTDISQSSAVESNPRPAAGGDAWRITLRLLLHSVLIIWGITALYPIVWMFLTSLKFTSELYDNPFALPKFWNWFNYVDAWFVGRLGQNFWNSVQVTALSTVLVVWVGSMCGFALARFNFKLKAFVLAFLMFGLLIPHSTLLIPLAIFTREIGIYDSVLGLALVYAAAGVPFHTFFLWAYMETIPKEIEEAAIMDGATMWTVYWRIILPVSVPALVTMATFNILYAWSEFIVALVITGTDASRTLPVGVALLESTFLSNEPAVAAGLVISLIPALLIYAALQRYVTAGLTAGAVKG